MKNKRLLVERTVDIKLILMAAWLTLMCLYIYCDILSLYRPGQLSNMINGKMGPFDVSSMGIFWAALLMVIPSIMILISPLASARVSRIINVIVSPLYFLINIGNLISETWLYYYLFGVLELALTVFIFITAFRWPKQEN